MTKKQKLFCQMDTVYFLNEASVSNFVSLFSEKLILWNLKIELRQYLKLVAKWTLLSAKYEMKNIYIFFFASI